MLEDEDDWIREDRRDHRKWLKEQVPGCSHQEIDQSVYCLDCRHYGWHCDECNLYAEGY